MIEFKILKNNKDIDIINNISILLKFKAESK